MAATVWKGFIGFGLVSFPVRLQAAARSKPVRFHLLHKKDLSRIKEVYYCREENKPLDRSDMVKGYEVSKDEFVVVEAEELAKIAPKTAKVMDIIQFVNADEFDPVFLDKSYHILPDGEISKPYALLREVMKKRGQYAIAKVAMHNREHIVVLRPSGEELMLHTMFFVNEIQKAEVKAGSPKFSAKELQLAAQLIDSLSAKFEPGKFHDEYQKNVAELVEQKQQGGKVHFAKQAKPKAVVNILEALQKSLAESKGAPGTHGKGRKHRAA